MSTSSAAGIISVNFDSSTGGEAVLDPGTSAGLVAATNWNNISSDAQSGTTVLGALTDDSGAATTASIEVFNGFWRDGVSSSTGDHQMFSDYTNTSATAGGTITVSGLEPTFTIPGYSVIVYMGGTDNMGLDTAIEVAADIGSGPEWIRVLRRDPSFNGSYSSTTFADEATANASGTESNYIRFDGLTASGFSLDILKDSSSTQAWSRASVSGIQIVAVPEPSAALLAGLGALGLLRRRRS